MEISQDDARAIDTTMNSGAVYSPVAFSAR